MPVNVRQQSALPLNTEDEGNNGNRSELLQVGSL